MYRFGGVSGAVVGFRAEALVTERGSPEIGGSPVLAREDGEEASPIEEDLRSFPLSPPICLVAAAKPVSKGASLLRISPSGLGRAGRGAESPGRPPGG